jgi:hypothetical protein
MRLKLGSLASQLPGMPSVAAGRLPWNWPRQLATDPCAVSRVPATGFAALWLPAGVVARTPGPGWSLVAGLWLPPVLPQLRRCRGPCLSSRAGYLDQQLRDALDWRTAGRKRSAEPSAVAAYLASLASHYSRAALERRLAAIGHQHRLRDLAWSAGHPAIRTTLRGVYRRHGSWPRQAAALTSAELRKLVAVCPGDRTGPRDRALLLLLGFAGALRRSEPVGIDRKHLRFTEAGLRLLLPADDREAVAAEQEAAALRQRLRAWRTG